MFLEVSIQLIFLTLDYKFLSPYILPFQQFSTHKGINPTSPQICHECLPATKPLDTELKLMVPISEHLLRARNLHPSSAILSTPCLGDTLYAFYKRDYVKLSLCE